jgi:hypothetical protein
MNLLPAMQQCVAMHTPAHHASRGTWRKGGHAELEVGTEELEWSWRVPGGLWSRWVKGSSQGVLSIYHPRLMLDGQRIVELRARAKGLVASEAVSVRLDDAGAKTR